MYKDNDQIVGILKNGKYYFLLNEVGCFLEFNCSNVDLLQVVLLKFFGNSNFFVSF